MNILNSTLKRLNLKNLIKPNIQKTKRMIVEETKDYSIVLFHWKQNQRVPMHDHEGNCVFKMLSGEMNETRIINGKIQYNVLIDNSIGKLNRGDLHTIIPIKDSVSIHYYSPSPKKLCPSMEHIKLDL